MSVKEMVVEVLGRLAYIALGMILCLVLISNGVI